MADSNTSKDSLLASIESFINDELDEESISFGLRAAIGDNFIRSPAGFSP